MSEVYGTMRKLVEICVYSGHMNSYILIGKSKKYQYRQLCIMDQKTILLGTAIFTFTIFTTIFAIFTF